VCGVCVCVCCLLIAMHTCTRVFCAHARVCIHVRLRTLANVSVTTITSADTSRANTNWNNCYKRTANGNVSYTPWFLQRALEHLVVGAVSRGEREQEADGTAGHHARAGKHEAFPPAGCSI